MHTAFLSLSQSDLHDFLADAFNLDVHLQSGHAVIGTGNLEVHIAEVVFVAENIGQNGKLIAFLDQAHGNTGHEVFQRHAGIQQRQAAAADARHRGRTVGFADFGNHTHGVLEIFFVRQNGSQGAFSQTAVTDFASLRRADAAGFAGSKRRHVVVKHEAFTLLSGQTVNDLFVLFGAQSCDNQSLGFTAGEERRAVSTRKNAGANFDRTNGTGVAAVDTRFAGKNLAANVSSFHFKENVGDFVLTDIGKFADFNGCVNFLVNVIIDRAQAFVAVLLAAVFVSFMNTVADNLINECNELLVAFCRSPVPQRFAAFFNEFVDGFDNNLHFFVAEHYGAEHDFFRELISFGLNHQDGAFRAGNDEVELGIFHLRKVRAENVFVVNVADAGGCNRAVEGYAGNSQSCRCCDHGRNVGINFGVHGKDVNNDLNFIEEAFREQRTDRTVDQAGSERFFFARTAFALEEASRNPAGSVSLFNVINGQREEILTRFNFFLCNNGG